MKELHIKPKCVLCGEIAITTVTHIPVCKKHNDEYQTEGEKYLPYSQRPVYQRLLNAEEKLRKERRIK